MCSCSGLPVVSVSSSDWCTVRYLGQEVFPPHDSFLHLRPHSLHEDQPLVSPTVCKHVLLSCLECCDAVRGDMQTMYGQSLSVTFTSLTFCMPSLLSNSYVSFNIKHYFKVDYSFCMSVSVLFGIGVLYFSFSPEDDAEKSFSYIKILFPVDCLSPLMS